MRLFAPLSPPLSFSQCSNLRLSYNSRSRLLIHHKERTGNLWIISINGAYLISLLDPSKRIITKFHLRHKKIFVIGWPSSNNSDAVPFSKRRWSDLVIGLSWVRRMFGALGFFRQTTQVMTYLDVVLLFFQWFYWGSLGPWLALAHELGHNFNFDHDNSKLNILRLMNIYSEIRLSTTNGALLIAKSDI